MDIMEGIRAGFKELIVPELDRIREENREIRAVLEVTNKRLDDVNLHLADQSRRIDALREELRSDIQAIWGRHDASREELRSGFKENNDRIDSLRERMGSEIRDTSEKFDSRLDRLYEVIVRRDEHVQLAQRLTALEREVSEIKRKLAA